jgi:hypothetical protein
MTEKLDNGDPNARRAYIRSIVDAIEVGDKAIRIIGSKDVLQAVIAGKPTANGNVRGSYAIGAPLRAMMRTRMYLKYQYNFKRIF